MDDILSQIHKKLNKAEQNEREIRIAQDLYESNNPLLSKEDKLQLKEFIALKSKKSVLNNLSFLNKYSDFIYNENEIENAKENKWYIPEFIPEQSIGILYGPSGAGKTTIAMTICQILLFSNHNIHIVYIDGDMSVNKLKENGVHLLQKKYNERFIYAGKNSNDFTESAQNMLRDISNLQLENKNRKYFVIQDSLTLTSRKRRGFIDTVELYRNDRKIRNAGGSTLLIHHTNKNGVFADSQQIENYADYSFRIERNDFNKCILLHPDKQSRFEIKGKAYKIENKKIAEEVNYEEMNRSPLETMFTNYIVDILDSETLNQREIVTELRQAGLLTKLSIGDKKAIKLLKKIANENKIEMFQDGTNKNAITYKLPSLPNCQTKK